ncbi:hypothetical protein FXN61_22325 [Lentzea sp. PSKA42]|uniref:Uncharacterized protein n=1 Tax=Lentzea indica TaxID=2604800 RepID=A0ABX1FL17_9PSEU|nr:hypothetical protein [Lentzea indica]NKE59396.1 hypothetical protein [Lentzea indica]
MTVNSAGFVPEVELSAYERERPVLDEYLLEVRRVRFYATGHRWPLVLGDGEIAVALHVAVGPLPEDVDELAALAFHGVLREGLDYARALDLATRALFQRITLGTATGEDRGLFLEWWNSADRYQACMEAAARLCVHAPRSPRTLPAVDSPAPWEVA